MVAIIGRSGKSAGMVIAFLVIGGVAGALVALGALLTFGLGPVAALMVFWVGALAATLALAASFARNTTLASARDEGQNSRTSSEDG